MTGDFFLHYTSFDGFKGILCGHEDNKLCFHLSNSQDMNDEREIHLGTEIIEQVCRFFPFALVPKRSVPIEDCYVLSLSRNTDFSSMSDYGNIALKISKEYNEWLLDLTFRRCHYVKMEKSQEIVLSLAHEMRKIENALLIPMILPFYIKCEKWVKENEWRVVENAQDGQVVYQKINSKGKKIRYIECTMKHNTLKGVHISKSVSVEQEKEINEILSSLSYSFKAKRVE